MNLFGSHRYEAGQDYTVTLTTADTADSNCHYEMADQMRWVFDGSAPVPVPVATAPPTVAGRAVAGQTLAESHGGWTNDPTAYAYQWEDCDAAGRELRGDRGRDRAGLHADPTGCRAHGPGGRGRGQRRGRRRRGALGAHRACHGPAGGQPRRISYTYAARRAWTTFRALTVSRVARHATVRASCRGRGCPRRKVRVTGRRTVRLKPFLHRRLRPHARITVVVSRSGLATKTFRLTVRKGRAPKLT